MRFKSKTKNGGKTRDKTLQRRGVILWNNHTKAPPAFGPKNRRITNTQDPERCQVDHERYLDHKFFITFSRISSHSHEKLLNLNSLS